MWIDIKIQIKHYSGGKISQISCYTSWNIKLNAVSEQVPHLVKVLFFYDYKAPAIINCH